MWIENGLLRRPPPKPDRRISRIRLSSSWRLMDWLRHSTQGYRKSRTSRVGLRPAHLSCRRSTVNAHQNTTPAPAAPPGEQPCGTTRTLTGCCPSHAQHHVPASLRSTVVTRFYATTEALTPAGPCATSRGSLIHVARISDHSVSNHLRCSAPRHLLAQRGPLAGARASPLPSRLASTADRIEFTMRG